MVQGLRGERQGYKPVRSELFAGSDPLVAAEALCRACGGHALYLADLDAISGTGDHLETIRRIVAHVGAEPWVDAGVSDVEGALRLLEAGAARVIVGTETLPDVERLRALYDAVPAEKLIVSLDVGAHGVLSRCPSLSGRSPLAGLESIVDQGATDVILLALTQVGTGTRPDVGDPPCCAGRVSPAAPDRRRGRA